MESCYLRSTFTTGGLPLWLRNIQGMAVRSSNAPWEMEMARFVKDIAKLVTPYLAKNGGPIVLAQIENEINTGDSAYVQWCGDLANGLNLGIPWLMCNGDSANNTINSCNGNDCSKYASSHAQKFPGQPLAWTEDEGWFQEWDKAPNSSDYDNRTPQDMAYVILKWFARGGCHHNYYMWYGGNHFAQWAANGVTNKYANGVNLHHDTLPNEPKKTHLKTLHQVLAKYSQIMLNTALKDIHVYHVQVFDPKTKKFVTSTQQWAFDFNTQLILLENDADTDVEVLMGTRFFYCKAYSVLVIEYGSLNVMYDSANVSYTNLPTKRVFNPLVPKLSWKAWQENVSDLQGGFSTSPPLEQLLLTMANTDYLFYQTRVKVSSTGSFTVRINSTDANAFLAFIDGELQSSTYNTEHHYNAFNVMYSLQVTINDTDWHNLTLLSVNLGTDNGVPPGSFDSKGIVHGVTLNSEDLTTNVWLHRPKLEGEIEQIFTTEGSTKVDWNQDITKYVKKPVVWFQAEFTHVEVKSGHSMLLDLAGMGRGHIFLNGFPLGRYWSIKVDGVYVQRYYFIPPDLIAETNLLTLVEEVGAADPASVNIVDSTFVVP